jgi:hypothetical protein
LAFYVHVLRGVVEDVLHMFVMPIYENLASQGHTQSSGVGFPFVPLSRSQHSADADWQAQEDSYSLAYQQQGSQQHTGAGCEYTAVDCTDDVVEMLAAFCRAYPPMVASFWNERGAAHPFTKRALEGVIHDYTLIVPLARLLLALCGGCDSGASAYFVFNFVSKNRVAGRFDWAFFFQTIEERALLLGAPPIELGFAMGQAVASTAMDRDKGSTGRARRLRDVDAEILEAIIDLVAAVLRSPQAATELFQIEYLQPVPRLFSLLACPVQLGLKGSILRALAAVASQSDALAREIWHAIEEYQLLATLPGASSAAEDSAGLREDLEMEARNGLYPATDGFLVLLHRLVCSPALHIDDLGLGYRIPGIIAYLEYAAFDVFLAAPRLPVGPNVCGEGHRWRLVSRSLAVLLAVLQRYPINRIPPDSIHASDGQQQGDSPTESQPRAARTHAVTASATINNNSSNNNTSSFDDAQQGHYSSLSALAADFSEEKCIYETSAGSQLWPRPKSSGFVLMTWLLCQGRGVPACLLACLPACLLACLFACSHQMHTPPLPFPLLFPSLCPPKRTRTCTCTYTHIPIPKYQNTNTCLLLLAFACFCLPASH